MSSRPARAVSAQPDFFDAAALDKMVPAETLIAHTLRRLEKPTNQALNAFFEELPRLRSAMSDADFVALVRRLPALLPAENDNGLPSLALSIPEWGAVAGGELREICRVLALTPGSRHCALHACAHWLDGDADFIREVWARAKAERDATNPYAVTAFAFILANNEMLSALVPEILEELSATGDRKLIRYAKEAAQRVQRARGETGDVDAGTSAGETAEDAEDDFCEEGSLDDGADAA